MEDTLQIKDFIDFDEFFTEMKLKIYEKQVKGKLSSEDLV
jgi:hypothetical protein